MRRLATPLFAGAFFGLLAASGTGAVAQDGRSKVVTFDQYTPLAGNLMMAERLLTPLTGAQLRDRLAAAGKGLRDQPVDLTQEQFRIYVPERNRPRVSACSFLSRLGTKTTCPRVGRPRSMRKA
jgi:hypothetical protein